MINNLNSKFKDLSVTTKMLMVLILLRFSYFPRAIFGQYVWYAIYYSIIIIIASKELMKLKGRFLNRRIFYILLPLVIFTGIFFVKIIEAKRFDFGFFSPITDLIGLGNLILVTFVGLSIKISNSEKRLLGIGSLTVLFISSLYSYGFLVFIDPLALRRGNAVNYGVVDYSIIYVIIFLPILINYLFTKFAGDFKLMIFKYALLLFFLIFLVKAGFITAVLIYTLSFILSQIFTMKSFDLKRTTKFLLVFVILLFVFRYQVAFLIEIFANIISKNWVMSKKLIAISNVLKGDFTNIDTLGERVYLIGRSINSFSKHFFFGINFTHFNKYTIGNHSQFFDDLAKMGIMVTFYFAFLYRYIKNSSLVNNSYSKITIIIFILLGLLNPNLAGTITFTVFLVLIPTFETSEENAIEEVESVNRDFNPLVSVIVPAYNAEKSIVSCLGSITSQLYSNIEILVIDDGSTDSTPHVIEKLSLIDPRIRFVSKENGGVSSARNLGIELSKGQYCCFLDSDDLYLPNFISTLLCDESDLFFSGYQVNSDLKTTSVVNKWSRLIGKTNTGLVEDYISRKINLHTSNWIIKKSILENHNIRFTEGLNWCEDILFFTTVISKAQSIKYSREYLTIYRTGVENSLSSVALSRIESEKRAMKIIKDIYPTESNLINLIDNYRVPATAIYMLIDFLNSGQDINDLYYIFKEHNDFTKYPNGLRSVKLSIMKIKLLIHFRKITIYKSSNFMK